MPLVLVSLGVYILAPEQLGSRLFLQSVYPSAGSLLAW